MCFYRYGSICISLLSLINHSHACETNFIEEIDSNYVDIKFIPVEDEKYIVYRIGNTDDGISRRFFHNPKFAIVDKNTCKLLKILVLNPQDDVVNAENSQHEVLLNKKANKIIVSQYWYVLNEAETYRTISSFNYLTLKKELEKNLEPNLFWERSRKYFINNGKEIIVQNKNRDGGIILQKINVEDLRLFSKYIIDTKLLRKIGIQSKPGFDVVKVSKTNFDKKNLEWFYPESTVTLMSIFGVDKSGNPRAIYYSEDNQPQAALWYQDDQLYHRPIDEFESIFDVKVSNLIELKRK